MTNAAAPRPTIVVAERPSAVALNLALHLVVGQGNSATAAWLRAGFLRWFKSDGTLSLSECLHLGNSPRHVRLAVRDAWLHDAATYVEGCSPWNKAKALHAAAQHFERYRWPTWRRKLEAPPLTSGSAIDNALFGAMLAEPHLPQTVEAWYALAKRFAGTA